MAINVSVRRVKVNKNYFGNATPSYVFDDTSQAIPGTVAPFVHVEKNVLTDLESHTVTVLFGYSFVNQPLEILMEVTKMTLQADGGYLPQNIPWSYDDILQPTIDGFEITINPIFTPDLTGVKVRYKFEEL
jgi:hypothetical protein